VEKEIEGGRSSGRGHREESGGRPGLGQGALMGLHGPKRLGLGLGFHFLSFFPFVNSSYIFK
jgi:hypothetical protein